MPWPPEWPEKIELRYYLSFALITLIAVCALAVGVYLLSSGTANAFKYCVVFAAVCGATAFGGYATRFDRRRSGVRNIKYVTTVDGGGALKIPYSCKVYASYALVMGFIAVGFAFGILDSVQATGDSATAGIVICSVLVILFASLPLAMLTGRFALGYILIMPDGVYQRGWTFTMYLPWETIVEVSPYYLQEPYLRVAAATNASWEGKQIHKLWKQDRLPANPEIIVSGKFLGADRVIVYAILHHYRTNPAMRSELSNAAVVSRLRAGAFSDD